jgi:hypothetical protein
LFPLWTCVSATKLAGGSASPPAADWSRKTIGPAHLSISGAGRSATDERTARPSFAVERLKIQMSCFGFRLKPRRVTDVALNCGFSNLGHFAKDYQQAFGELVGPGRTLQLVKLEIVAPPASGHRTGIRWLKHVPRNIIDLLTLLSYEHTRHQLPSQMGFPATYPKRPRRHHLRCRATQQLFAYVKAIGLSSVEIEEDTRQCL